MIKNRFYIFVAAMGLVFFLLISSSAVFKGLLGYIFPKPSFRTQANEQTPVVDLKISRKGGVSDGVVNPAKGEGGMVLTWTTSKNPDSCWGLSYGFYDRDSSWDGPKDPKGGTFMVRKLSVNNPYVYTINCTNTSGDGSGDAVTINFGADDNLISPYITSFDIYLGGKKYGGQNYIPVQKGDVANIKWSTVNLSTPYSICVVSGLSNSGLKSRNGYRGDETITITSDKIMHYSLYCSNEHGFTRQDAAFFPE